MKIILGLIVVLLFSLGCSVEEESVFNPVEKKGSSVKVDPKILGQDMNWGPYWQADLDFRRADVFYFDPTAPTSGDGSVRRPFQSLSVELESGDIIQKYGPDGTCPNPAAPVGPGDVCALLDGNHGNILFDQYYNTDYLAIVAATNQSPTFQKLNIVESKRFFIQGLSCTRSRAEYYAEENGGAEEILEGTFWSGAPNMIFIKGNDAGTMPSQFVIIKDCILQSAPDISGWGAWDWNREAANGIRTYFVDYFHFDNNTLRHVNYAFSGMGLTYGSWVGNLIHHLNSNAIQIGNLPYPSATYFYFAGNKMSDFYVTNENHVGGIHIWNGNPGPTIVEKNWICQTTDLDREFIGPMANLNFSVGDTDLYHVDTEISNNIVMTNCWDGIFVRRGRESKIVNNTCVTLFAEGDPRLWDIDNWNEDYEIMQARPGFPIVRFWDENQHIDCQVSNNVCSALEYDALGVTHSNNLTYRYDFSAAGFMAWAAGGEPLSHDLLPELGGPLINSGTEAGAPVDDFVGTSRPQGQGYDIGAYERILQVVIDD